MIACLPFGVDETFSMAEFKESYLFFLQAHLSKHLKSQLDPPVRDLTFFLIKEVGWFLLSVTSRFWDQRRSVGSPCWLGNVLGS